MTTSTLKMPLINLELSKMGPYIALLILVGISAFASEHFFSASNLMNIARQVSYTGIIALGMTFVIIAGGIDLSVGSAMAFIGGMLIICLNYFSVAIGHENQAMCVALALAVAVAMGVASGFLSGLIITKGRIAPFVVTLGFMGIFRSLALYIGEGGEFRVSYDITLFEAIGGGKWLGVFIPVWIFLGLGIIFTILLNWTRFGRYTCAVGSNERVAKYAGVKVDRIRIYTYMICGFTVAISAFLMGGRMNSLASSNAGNLYELDAIAAVIIGGTAMSGGNGSIAGTVAGALILGIINNMLNMLGVSAYLQGTVKGSVIIIAVLVQQPMVQEFVRSAFNRIIKRPGQSS